MKKTNVIRIGHSAYKGANAMRMCFSKAQAVRVLRMRGLLRDKARAIVNEVCSSDAGSATVYATPYGEVIEVNNEAWSIKQGHYCNIDATRMSWTKAPEA